MSLIRPIILPSSCSSQDYELDIYRGDLEHPNAPGNKWHKLQYHLAAAKQQNVSTIATFGGPFSNHLHAFGATLAHLPFKAIAVVRGELQPKLTPTLLDLVAGGVELWPSSRSDYRLGTESDIAHDISDYYGNVYWIPEGGGGSLGALGCKDWASSIYQMNSDYDAWVISAGTGTTAAGLLANHSTPDLHVFSALKGADGQREDILDQAMQIVGNSVSKEAVNKRLFFHSGCHEGGYAKFSPALHDFLQEFATMNPGNILDPVYTCKSMLAVTNAIKEGVWPYRRTLFIHTGGLQGWRGYSSSCNPFLAL